MNQETIEFLRQLSDKIGDTGAQAFHYAVEHTMVSSGIAVATALFVIALALISVAVIWRYTMHAEEESYESRDFKSIVRGVTTAIAILISIIALMVGSAHLSTYLTPKGATVKQMVRNCGGG